MKRIRVLSVILLVVGAVEFGLLGAGSAGASFLPGWHASKGGTSATRDHRPTPTTTPVSLPASPPCHPDRQHEHEDACSREPASIQLTPDPLVIHCDGYDHSTLTVRITDAKGRPVTDGTYVTVWAYNGTTAPTSMRTRGGVVSTSVALYGELFNVGPNVNVEVGALEAGIRIRCFPDSNRPPCSPPPSSPSPRCVTPTPTPPSPPCSTGSPPSVSPPCAWPTPPPCSVSPPSSPPCPTPTPTWTPPPTATPVLGGEISFGTPSLAAGKITIPIMTSASPNPWVGFNLHVTFDGSLLVGTALQAGDTLQAVASGYFCTSLLSDGGPNGGVAGCALLERSTTSSAGSLATLTFTPRAAIGCARLHLYTYGPPDGGDTSYGTYTMDANILPEHNTYGPDITVNLADGTTGCAAPPLPTSTPTPTPSPWSPPVGTSTATPTPTATRTPLTVRTLTATPTSPGGIVPIEICVPLPGSACPTLTPTPSAIPAG